MPTTDLEPVREQTDLGLDKERAKTDVALLQSGVESEQIADADLEKRRAKDDQEMRTQRAHSDAVLLENLGKDPGFQSEAVDSARAIAAHERDCERTLADSMMERERDHADEVVRLERAEHRLVGEQLGAERAETDDRLRQERERTDAVVADAGDLLSNAQAAHGRAKAAAVRSNELLAFVSHELRNPLTIIALNAQALMEPTPADLREVMSRQISDDVQVACAQMTRLVSDLLDGVSADTGRLRVVRTPGDVTRLVGDAIAANALVLKQQRLSLSVDHPPGPLFAHFDHARLLQVFANLFTNAVKFTAPGGTISISIAIVGPEFRFCVADTGSGFPKKDAAHVFERFWQLKKSDRRGLGLGLFISKAIVEEHGGRMWASSEIGVGSQFFFTIPVRRSE